ncbi:hypothetical protein B0T10DRAFT_477478 [Thelonectria olida]|uniref:Uncharacterized protein n=1 Tax=Thelonectria olida TaxID=1576542 RepID=A0A9P8WF13_9HYPO|nr:hypothetical protein B0T10DRAFT_477478 [Thelonectria olida]
MMNPRLLFSSSSSVAFQGSVLFCPVQFPIGHRRLQLARSSLCYCSFLIAFNNLIGFYYYEYSYLLPKCGRRFQIDREN